MAPRHQPPTGAPNAAFPSPTSSSPRNGRKSPTTQHVTRPLGSRQPERETHDQTHICVPAEALLFIAARLAVTGLVAPFTRLGTPKRSKKAESANSPKPRDVSTRG